MVYYDDMMWWIISLARAYEITNDPKYLAHASFGIRGVGTMSGKSRMIKKGGPVVELQARWKDGLHQLSDYGGRHDSL